MTTAALPKPPAEAMPVIRLIREKTKRPKMLPWLDEDAALRFPCGRCPAGFLPGATDDVPGDAEEAGLPVELAPSFYLFWAWWDSLEEQHARAAVDLVWGRGRRR